MSNFKKLLVPTDFSPCAEQALDYAMQIATSESEVMLLHIFAFPYDWYYWEGLEVETLRASVEQYAREKLAELASRKQRPGIEISHRLFAKSHVGKALCTVIEEEQPDVVVMGTKGWTDEAPEMGSVAEQIVRRSETPVLMVPKDAAGFKDSPRILVPLYASEASAAALRVGETVAELLGGRLDILHVHPDVPFASAYLGDEPIGAGDLLESEYRLKRLQKFAARYVEPSTKCRVHLEEGEFVDEVADFVEDEGIDLVVVARSDTSNRPHKAELIAHHVACPVLVIPAPLALAHAKKPAVQFASPQDSLLEVSP